MNSITIQANAKINLALFVRYKREDGFHEIESIFQEIDFADRITVKRSEGIVFNTNSKRLSNSRKNLCTDAGYLLKEECKIPGLEISLQKIIPISAGLGGGSSDAAAVLKAGLKLYKVKLSRKKLSSLAAKLGSDVPFFLSGKTAYVYGRGDGIRKIRSQYNYYIVLIIPKLSISTSWAYKNLRLGLTKKECNLKLISLEFYGLNVEDFKKFFYNDFEESVFKVYPQLREIKHSLYKEGADYASLSGSGSTIFGIFQSPDTANRACNLLSRFYRCELVKPVL